MTCERRWQILHSYWLSLAKFAVHMHKVVQSLTFVAWPASLDTPTFRRQRSLSLLSPEVASSPLKMNRIMSLCCCVSLAVWTVLQASNIRCVRLHAAPRRSSAAWQKQCILVRTFVRLWSALQPPYDHMCHQSTARAKRDQPLRSGAAVAQNRLLKPWWRHTLFSLVRFCDDKHEVCCLFILSIKLQ